ncbi:MAG: hypothetical protein Q8K73_06175, partial [Anaerolineales bacterium]|nr:hypothetical protein [Anaerolineales bacterium]
MNYNGIIRRGHPMVTSPFTSSFLLFFHFLRLLFFCFVAAHFSEECAYANKDEIQRDADDDPNWQDIDHKADNKLSEAFKEVNHSPYAARQ